MAAQGYRLRFPGSANVHCDCSCNPGADVALRCLIVDDSPSFLEATHSLLAGQGIAVVGVATSSAEALQLAEKLRPDVALVDIYLGDESGFEVARRLVDRTSRPAPSVILISTYDEREFGDLIEASPAVGFLAKKNLSAETIHRLLARIDEPDATGA